MLKAHDNLGKKPRTEVRNIEFISKQPSQFFVFTILPLQFKFSVHLCILCCLIAFPPHPFAYFPTSGYLLQTPDSSNFFQFPLKVGVIRSQLYLSLLHLNHIYLHIRLPLDHQHLHSHHQHLQTKKDEH